MGCREGSGGRVGGIYMLRLCRCSRPRSGLWWMIGVGWIRWLQSVGNPCDNGGGAGLMLQAGSPVEAVIREHSGCVTRMVDPGVDRLDTRSYHTTHLHHRQCKSACSRRSGIGPTDDSKDMYQLVVMALLQSCGVISVGFVWRYSRAFSRFRMTAKPSSRC